MAHEQDPSLSIPRRSILATAGAVCGAIVASGLFEACGSPEADPFQNTPAWDQDFSTMADGALDTRLWTVNTGTTIPEYNHEAEALTDMPQNIRIENGVLILEGQKEPYPYEGKEYTSARIVSKHTFTYGKLGSCSPFSRRSRNMACAMAVAKQRLIPAATVGY